MAELYTFGYEGLAIDAFIARLKSARVETVIDVRANPLSRKRGFSKTSFAIALRAAGIEYRHVVAMGCPKPVRDQYKEDGNWATYTRGFMRHLSKNGAAQRGSGPGKGIDLLPRLFWPAFVAKAALLLFRSIRDHVREASVRTYVGCR